MTLDRLSPTERAALIDWLARVSLAAALRDRQDDRPPDRAEEEIVRD